MKLKTKIRAGRLAVNHNSIVVFRLPSPIPRLESRNLLYNLDSHGYFNDITGIGQATNNNGLFPTTPGYDLATGIGTPKMKALITGIPQP